VKFSVQKADQNFMQLSTKLTESWPGNTLEGLENDIWEYPEFDSYLLNVRFGLIKEVG
jgi:hypothetical protein